MEYLSAMRWSPYWAGIGIGLLVCAMFLTLQKPLGCSTAFAKFSGMLEALLGGSKVAKNEYFQKVGLHVDWQVMLVLGIALGAYLSARLSGDFGLAWVPGRWQLAFGEQLPHRVMAALSGGLLLGFGARWADGCTSGHGISGTAQLAVSSWVSAACFFAGGIVTAWILF